MTFDEFITRYTRRPIDFDGVYGPQCFDLYRQYCKEVLGIPQSPATGSQGAKVIWNNYLKEYLFATPNSPLNSPQKGDIVIWGSKIGPYGHVAVCVSGGTMSFVSFDQNWSNHPYCEQVKHSYTGVLGWLRKKPILVQDTVPPSEPIGPPVAPQNAPEIVVEEKPVVDTTPIETPVPTTNPGVETPQEYIDIMTPINELPTTPDVTPISNPGIKQNILGWLLELLLKWIKSRE